MTETSMQKSEKKTGRQLFISGLLVFAAVLLDQATKWLAATRLKNSPVELIHGVFELRYLENDSAAFSLDPISILHRIFHFKYFDANPQGFLAFKMIFFVLFTVIVALVLIHFYHRIPWKKRFWPVNLIVLLLLAGAFGNLIDRVVHRYVIDFLYFSLIEFPVFNVADIYVTVAAFLLVFVMFFVYKDEDLDVLFPKWRKEEHADAE